jgi:hypothetical protein
VGVEAKANRRDKDGTYPGRDDRPRASNETHLEPMGIGGFPLATRPDYSVARGTR